MKTMGKIITGVLIVSVIFMYIKNRKEYSEKELKKTCDVGIQTESIYTNNILDDLYTEEKTYNDIDESKNGLLIEEEYIQTENLDIQEVENLDSPSSEHSELNNLNVIELKDLAKLQNIKGYSRMKKAELIEILS